MYKYLRKMMDLADAFGKVEDCYMGDWYANVVFRDEDGKKFTLSINMEVEKNAD